jgi:hypothetical protein
MMEVYAVENSANLPGSIRVAVVGEPDTVASLLRNGNPVRNFSGLDSGGLAQVVDAEAPLGRAAVYSVVAPDGTLLASSAPVVCPPLPSGESLIRSVLRPSVAWMEVHPVDETGVRWRSSTTVHEVVGSDTPVVVGEVRQRRTGVMSFLCRSLAEADRLVLLLRDGTPVLLRFDPCAQPQVRDLLFYALDVNEIRWGRSGGRLVVVDYQDTAFVPGLTDEYGTGWDFAGLRDSAATFGELNGLFANFAAMAMNIRRP